MPTTLRVGLSRKQGLPDFGSLGASCELEVELDVACWRDANGNLAGQIERVYAVCSAAVTAELLRQQGLSPTAAANSDGLSRGNGPDSVTPTEPNGAPTASPRTGSNGHHGQNGHRNGNGQGDGHGNGHTNGTSHARATAKQMDYLRQLAGQIDGLGVRRLDLLAQQLRGKPLADLTGLDASVLIDTLKAVKAGRLSWEAIGAEVPQ